jgi:hypothetical protein
MSGMPPCHNSVHKDSRGGCCKRYRENLSKLFDESGKMKSGDSGTQQKLCYYLHPTNKSLNIYTDGYRCHCPPCPAFCPNCINDCKKGQYGWCDKFVFASDDKQCELGKISKVELQRRESKYEV